MHVLVLLLFSIIVNEGPIIDPDGGRPHVRAQNGSCPDPDGRCVHALDNGDGRSIIDPIGRARIRALGDSGGGMDPNGNNATAAPGQWPWQG